MVRKISFLLALLIFLSCLSGCSFTLPEFLQELLGENGASDTPSDADSLWDGLFGTEPAEDLCIADQPKEVTDPLIVSDELRSALDNAIILRIGSSCAFVAGQQQVLESAAPQRVVDTILIPALAVAKLLQAECTQADDSVHIDLDGKTLTLTAGSDYAVLGDGSQVYLPMSVIPEAGDLLVSVEPFCDVLGQELVVRDEMLFIGKNISAAATDDSNGMAMIRSALSNEFTFNDPEIVSLGSISTGDGYFARVDRSACLTLTADMIPYTSENGETIAVAGSLYVEDLKVEPSSYRDDYYSCSMTVYNVGYTYGSVEAYSQDDNLIEFERIKPFEGQKASVTKALTDLVVLGEDIYQAIDNGSWAELDYRSSLNASKSTIRLEVPKDGYIFVTCNPLHSERVAVYNATHTFTTLISTAQNAMKSSDGGSAREALTDYLAEQVLSNANAAMEITMEFTKLLSDTAASPTSPTEYAKKLGNGILAMFQRCEFDIADALKGAAEDLGGDAVDKSVESWLTKVIPATQVAFTAWNISYTGSNLVCLFMDLAYCTRTRSVIIEIGDWRAAYAQLLRERGNKGGERFVLGYVNGDGIPDLMVTYAFAHYGSYVEFYTYQNRQVKKIVDEYCSQQLGVAYGVFYYAEFRSVLMRGNMHMGVTSTNYMHIIDNVITATEVFYDTAQSGKGAEYYYNGEQVARIYYEWKLNSFAGEYDEHMIRVDGGSDGWLISEENIKDILKR